MSYYREEYVRAAVLVGDRVASNCVESFRFIFVEAGPPQVELDVNFDVQTTTVYRLIRWE